MPLIEADKKGALLGPGTYYTNQLAVSASSKKIGAQIGVGELGLLTKKNTFVTEQKKIKKTKRSMIYSDSFKPCFPVVLKYTNGDVALYHSTGPSPSTMLERMKDLGLDKRGDLDEIQIFTKESSKKFTDLFYNELSERNVDCFVHATIKLQEDNRPHGAAICYYSGGQLIIIVGETNDDKELVDTLDKCKNQGGNSERNINPCVFSSTSVASSSQTRSQILSSTSPNPQSLGQQHKLLQRFKKLVQCCRPKKIDNPEPEVPPVSNKK